MKRIMMLILIILPVTSIVSMSSNETQLQNVREFVCERSYQPFENFPSFDKPFVINTEFLVDANIFLTSKIINANFRISNLLPWQWYDIKKVTYIIKKDRRQVVRQEIVDISKLPEFCLRHYKINILNIEVEMDLKKERPQGSPNFFDPKIINKIFNELKIQRVLSKEKIVIKSSPSKRIVGRAVVSPLEAKGLGLELLKYHVPVANYIITPETIKAIMNLEPNTIIRLIKYIQGAYFYREIISEDKDLRKWLTSKNVLSDVLQQKQGSLFDFIKQNNITVTTQDLAMLDKLDAYYEAGALWKAFGMIYEIAKTCSSPAKNKNDSKK